MKLESNIWKFYLYRVFQSLAFVTPVFVLFLLENGLSLTQIMILQSYYYLIIVLLGIPSGAFADKFGRKKTIILSSFSLLLGVITYATGYSFMHFFIAETFWSLGASLYFGIDSAFLYDTLYELKRKNEYKKVFGTALSFSQIFWGISAFIGGFIAIKSLRITWYYTLIPFTIAFFIPFTFKETKIHMSQTNYWQQMKNSVNFSLSHKKIRYFIIYSSVISAVWMVAFLMYQPYLKLINLDIKYFGLIYFLFFLSSAFGSKIAHVFELFFGKKILYLILIVPSLSLILMGFTKSFFGIALILIISFTFALSGPILSNYININAPSNKRATINSIQSLAGSLLFVVISPFFGWIAHKYSVHFFFFFGGMLLLIDLVILFLANFFKNKSDAV